MIVKIVIAIETATEIVIEKDQTVRVAKLNDIAAETDHLAEAPKETASQTMARPDELGAEAKIENQIIKDIDLKQDLEVVMLNTIKTNRIAKLKTPQKKNKMVMEMEMIAKMV